MKKNVSSIILVLVLCFTLVGTTLGESNVVDSMDFQGGGIDLTLEQAINQTIENSPSIKKAKLDLEQAEVNYDKYKSNLRKGKETADGKNKESSTYLENVKLVEVNGEYSYENSKRNYEITIESLKAQIEEAYYRLLQAQQSEEIRKANVETAKDLYEKTKKKFDLGLVAKQEVINSEVSMIEAENNYKSAQNVVKNNKMSLNIILGYDVMNEIKLKDDLTYKEFEAGGIAEAVSSALSKRNEIKAAEYRYEAAKINLAIVENRYPDVTYQYREAKVSLEKAEKDLKDARKSIEKEVRLNYLNLMQKQDEIIAGKKSVELAEEALRLSELSYDVGMSVLTDVQQAQTALLQAKLGLSQAILDYNLAVLQYEDSLGIGRTKM